MIFQSVVLRRLAASVFVLAVAGISLSALAVDARATSNVTYIASDEWNFKNIRTVVLSANGRRAYLGRYASYDSHRLNLLVVPLDENGKPTARPARYADSVVPLPDGAHSSVQALFLDEVRHKLYVSTGVNLAERTAENRYLSVYDLDADGDPVGAARGYATANPFNSIMAMARHPRLPLLYLVGHGGAAVYVQPLDARGEPAGAQKVFPAGAVGKYEVALSADAKRLYLGSAPDVLEIVDLDANGLPSGKVRAFKAGTENAYLKFALTRSALFFKRERPDGPRLASWPLDGSGEPVGVPQVSEGTSVSDVATAPDEAGVEQLYTAHDTSGVDAFSGKPIVDGAAAVCKRTGGDAEMVPLGPARLGFKSVAIAANGDGDAVVLTERLPRLPVVNRVRDFRLRFTLVEVQPQTPAGARKAYPVSLSLDKVRNLPALEPGTPSEWIDVNDSLRDQAGAVLGRLMVQGAPLAKFRARIELAQTASATEGTPLKALTEEVAGNHILFMVPGLAYVAPPPYLPSVLLKALPGTPATGDALQPERLQSERLAAFQLFSETTQSYLDLARRVGLKPGERPRLFNVSCEQTVGGQGSLEQLRRTAETVALLGFNTTSSFAWGNLPPAEVDAELDKQGLERRALAIYSPPAIFDYDKEKTSSAFLDKWATDFLAKALPGRGEAPKDVTSFKMADEPGWYFPLQLDQVRNNPAFLAEFRAYLKRAGETPGYYGKATWDEVFPVGASSVAGAAGENLGARRLWFHTNRFYSDSAARGFKLAREAIDRALGHRAAVSVNWNNWVNSTYQASPNKPIAKNPVVGPDTAMGGPDWLSAGRLGSHTLWTEDWFADQAAQQWSLYSDMMRSGTMLAPANDRQEFGAYIIGGTSGDHAEGMSYRVLSLLGHGAKGLDIYCYGPTPQFPGNGWSDQGRVYGPIANALRRVGKAERLLFPGRPPRGKVALFVPNRSTLWQTVSGNPQFVQEVGGLHSALVHAGYTVDFVDDADLEEDGFAARGYSVLYLTGPNVSHKAQEALREWVRGGGTLAVTPGAGTADEYNTLSDTLSPVLGLAARTAVRDIAPGMEGVSRTGMLGVGATSFSASQMALSGPIAPLTPTTASVQVKLKEGGAAVTTNQFGRGRALAYAFFPGWQYWVSPDRTDKTRLPLGWSADARRMAVAPAEIAKTPRVVTTDVPGVEACRVESEKGIAIVLLNWTDQPISNLTVTVPRNGEFRKVSSIEGSALKTAASGNGLTISLSLKNVDVLMVE